MKKHLRLLPLLLAVLTWNSYAQNEICTGNLGDNIFELGDFGSGQVNIPEKPDGIVSTYNYVKQGPPSDGNFTITNNTGVWINLYSSWIKMEDQSTDPNGYFMVINADFSPGVFYEQAIEGLCENTLYTFSADVINMVKNGTLNHILPNVSFLLDGEEKYSTGDIQQNERWITYGFTFTTGTGITAMNLSLRNNAPGGFGNDLAIDNITFRPCGPVAEILPKDIANICEDGDPIEINATINGDQYGMGAFQWQQSFDEGLTWENIDFANENAIQHTEKNAGFYYYRYLISNSVENLRNAKCRVNSNTKIIQVVPKFYTIEKEICEGLSFSVGNSKYNQSGIFTDSLISSIGCDSIVTTDLTVVPDVGINPFIQVNHPICFGDSAGAIDIPNIQNIRLPFHIQMGDREATSLVRFERLSARTYTIFIEDDIGCTFSQTVELIDPEQFIINIGGDLTIDLGESVTINPITNHPIDQFQWFPTQEERCTDDCLDQTFQPIVSNTYTLTAISEDGCAAIDSIFINVNPVRKVFIPNVFSPNRDGQNDYFSIYAAIPNVQEILQVAIFDRWGNLIFDIKNLNPMEGNDLWDGIYNGQIVERGVYLYFANILFLDGKKEIIQGSVTVIY